MRFAVCFAVWLLSAPTEQMEFLWDEKLTAIQTDRFTIREWKEKVYNPSYGSFMSGRGMKFGKEIYGCKFGAKRSEASATAL